MPDSRPYLQSVDSQADPRLLQTFWIALAVAVSLKLPSGAESISAERVNIEQYLDAVSILLV